MNRFIRNINKAVTGKVIQKKNSEFKKSSRKLPLCLTYTIVLAIKKSSVAVLR